MQSHPPKAIFVSIFAVLGMALLHAPIIHAYTYDTGNKTGYTTGYRTDDRAESKTPYDSAAESQYESEPISPLIGAPEREPTGPAAVFDRILRALIRKSDSQNERIKELRAAVPGILPDLYQVYLVL